MLEFQPFPKIARLRRDCVITEKIDGSNAQIHIDDDGFITAGSRTRWITPGKNTDNFGFAAWVVEHSEQLRELGPGTHYGEWWGSGIQRGYGAPKGEKYFSLFNVDRWSSAVRPACCRVVPVLYRGDFTTSAVDAALATLRDNGSMVAPGYMKPEGIIVWHVAARTMFKVTLENDHEPKGLIK